MKHLLGIEGLPREEIFGLLDLAAALKEILRRPIKKVPALRGKSIVTLFYEASTRTRVSFEVAAKVLSADTTSIAAQASSVQKGETLLDTVRNLEAMRPDVIVMRHSASGAPHFIARHLACSVVNAGDGFHEHPTQALLDAFTLRERWGALEGKTVAIVGDIAHSRVARSNLLLLRAAGARTRVCGPPTLIPRGIEQYGCAVTFSLREALAGADAAMILRIQNERLEGPLFPGAREYARTYGLDARSVEWLPPHAVVMHPGPMNRGVEIAPEVADGPRSIILDQVENGVAVRMAVLVRLLEGTQTEVPAR